MTSAMDASLSRTGEVRRSVVLAEDDPDISLLVSRKLTASGFSVQTVSDGRAAWRVIQEQRPSLVLLDIMMPGLTGVEVCRRMRSLPSTSDIPVILLTARAFNIVGDALDERLDPMRRR